MISHSTEKPYACPICQKRFKKKHDVTTHCRVVHQGKKYAQNTKYKCNICPKAFTTSSKLNDHTTYVHEGQKSHICEICSASYIWKTSLDQHIRMTHDGIRHYKKYFQCEVCGKDFKSRQGYSHHMKYVHGDACAMFVERKSIF
uniref:Zinc finger protein 91 n=1 Tax=Cacopsylla melanoneura TaxID=428564 RepID=A0A8D9DXJ4_9HEMI